MVAIPDYFFIKDGDLWKLHKKIAVIKSDSKVLAFCYQDEDKCLLPLLATRKNFKKAYTMSKAAALIGTTPGKLKEIFDNGVFPSPERSYDTDSFRPGRAYINENDMLDLRQVCYDLLAKNKLGIPYRDELTPEEELVHAMRLDDSRDYVVEKDGYYRVFRAE